MAEKRALIEKTAGEISIVRQCELMGIHRSGLYYRPRAVSKEERDIMRLIDEECTRTPFYGTRRLCVVLKERGIIINRKKMRRLMQEMGLEPIYPKPNLSIGNKMDKKYPYLLRGVLIDRVGQVWSEDITYIRLEQGFGYLTAIIDWFSRYVLSWRLSNLLDADFCLEALEEALGKGRPEIFTTDQGVQCTSREFTKRL